MNNKFAALTCLVAVLGVCCCPAAGQDDWFKMDEVKAWTSRVPVTVTNPASYAIKDVPVIVSAAELGIQDPNLNPGSLMVLDPQTRQMPLFQVDDMNADKVSDHVVWLVSLEPGASATFHVYYAQMGRAWPQQPRYTDAIDMPAWESEVFGYRSYGPMVIDMFAKYRQNPVLMLKTIYNAQNLQIYNYHRPNPLGHDILHINQTAGLAGTAIRSGDKTLIPVTGVPMTAKVLVSGPVRSILDVTQSPWESPAGTIQTSRRITMYAHHFETQVDEVVTVSKVADPAAAYGLGFRKVEGGDFTCRDDGGAYLQWHNQGDDIGPTGMGILISPKLVQSLAEDADNRIIMLGELKQDQPITSSYLVFGAWAPAGYVTNLEELAKLGSAITANQVQPKIEIGQAEPAPAAPAAN